MSGFWTMGGEVSLWCCAGALFSLELVACYDAPRDNPLDPALTPTVELLSVTVDSTSGSALLEWTPYAGQQPFAEYRVLRQVRDRVTVDTLVKIPQVQQTTFRDTTPQPGVVYGYWVEVVNQGGFDVASESREEVVYALPGVELLGAEFSSDTATAELVWTQYRGPRFEAYEVWRKVPELEKKKVAEVAGASDTTYTDTFLDGNTEYTYHIAVRTGWGKEVSVSSAEKSGKFYPLDHVLDLPSFPEGEGAPQAVGLAVDEQDHLYIATTLIVLPTGWGQGVMNQGVQVRFPGRDFETFFSEVHPHHLSAIHLVAGQGKVYVSVGLQDSTVLVGALDESGEDPWKQIVPTGGTLPVGLHLETDGRILMVDDQAVIYGFSPEGQKVEPDSRFHQSLGLYQVLPLGRVVVGAETGLRGLDQFFILAPAQRGFHVFTRTRARSGGFDQFEYPIIFDVGGTGIENNQTLSPVVLAFDRQRVRVLVLQSDGRLRATNKMTFWRRAAASRNGLRCPQSAYLWVNTPSSGALPLRLLLALWPTNFILLGALKVFDARPDDIRDRYITQWGRFGTGNGEFLIPVPVGAAMVVDSQGMIYAADGAERIQVFAPYP